MPPMSCMFPVNASGRLYATTREVHTQTKAPTCKNTRVVSSNRPLAYSENAQDIFKMKLPSQSSCAHGGFAPAREIVTSDTSVALAKIARTCSSLRERRA